MNVSRPGTPDNMIQYKCTASNGVGTSVTATVNVTIHCKYFNFKKPNNREIKA